MKQQMESEQLFSRFSQHSGPLEPIFLGHLILLAAGVAYLRNCSHSRMFSNAT
jgi:hypothetical protein